MRSAKDKFNTIIYFENAEISTSKVTRDGQLSSHVVKDNLYERNKNLKELAHQI